MPKHDQDAQRILTNVSKSSMETQKLSTIPRSEFQKSTQETQRIAHDTQNAVPVKLSIDAAKNIPFGTHKLSDEGVILRYNPFAGTSLSPENYQGKNFFSGVIPFESVISFAPQYQAAAKNRELYEEFKYHASCDGMKAFDVYITLYYSKNSDSFWALVNKAS